MFDSFKETVFDRWLV